jgi:UDP-N-acetylmuramate--alanine ligase
VFADEDAVITAFEGWLRAAAAYRETPIVVANVSDPGVARVVERFREWPGDLLAVALLGEQDDPDAARAAISDRFATGEGPAESIVGRLHAGASSGSPELELVGLPGGAPVRVTLGVPGRHNALNALGVAGAAAALGVTDDAIATGLGSFQGVGRRLELKGEPRGVTVLDDYGHHPTAIAATIEAVRERYPGRRLWAVYEPLTFHRTAAMLGEFAHVLAAADRAVIADIWAGRDPDRTVTSPEALALATARAGGKPATASGSPEDTAEFLAGAVAPGDVVLVMGGGRSYVIAEQLVERLGAGDGR